MSMMILLGILSPALAQMWENPCKARPDLKAQVAAGELNSVGAVEGPDFVAAVASSQLSPSSKPPPLGEEDTESPHRARDLWSCTYGAPNLIDGNPKTAWVEGAKGAGAGELVVVGVDVDKPIEIWSGFGKSAELHAANARPRQVEVFVFAGGEAVAADPGVPWVKNKLVASHTVELKDHNGYQPLPLPALSKDADMSGRSFVVVAIRSVYEGKKWQDTCISEIRNK